MHPHTGELEQADICAQLGTAVQQVFEHLQEHPEVAVFVEVSHDEDGELEGVGFFDENHEMLSCITAYRLERDTDVPTVPSIVEACLSPGPQMEGALNSVFRK